MTANGNLRTETFEWTGPAAGFPVTTEMSGLAYLTGIRDGIVAAPPNELLATAELLEVGPGRVQLICSVTDSNGGTSGELDAGIASFLVNAAIGCAAQTLVGLHQAWAIVASHVAHIRPATPKPGILFATADGVTLSHGRALVVGELTDETGQVLVTVTTTLEIFQSEG